MTKVQQTWSLGVITQGPHVTLGTSHTVRVPSGEHKVTVLVKLNNRSKVWLVLPARSGTVRRGLG